MPTQPKAPPTLRLWEENRAELEPLVQLGLTCGDVVNEALKQNGVLKRHVDRRIKELRERVLAHTKTA